MWRHSRIWRIPPALAQPVGSGRACVVSLSTSTSPTSTSDIRSAFLDFFARNGDHEVLPSHSLLPPQGDDSIMFTNAGMVPFKEKFLSALQDPSVDFRSATTSQGCVRAGGKHNDLESVGYTARHHTFFEMLGNFSFGRYGEEEAIDYAWRFLVKELQLNPNRLFVTTLEGDDRTADLWKKITSISPSHLQTSGPEDNFWSMGTGAGVCGPCTEIHYDCDRIDSDGERYLEIWNLVMMKNYRNTEGELLNLPRSGIDTGMGLERIASIMQGASSNYGTDNFVRIIEGLRGLTTSVPDTITVEKRAIAEKVIADHVRACSLLIADGLFPGNAGRGYVLRRLLRRGVRYGRELGFREPFMSELVPLVQETLGEAFPQVDINSSLIRTIISEEETMFFRTLDNGIGILTEALAKTSAGDVLPAQTVFTLYDTYGFPPDLTAAICRDSAVGVNLGAFDELMEKQKHRARLDRAQHSHLETSALDIRSRFLQLQDRGVFNQFCGYSGVSTSPGSALSVPSTILSAVHEHSETLDDHGVEDSYTWLLMDPCPFYPEGGGQIADSGTVEIDIPGREGSDSGVKSFAVVDCQRFYENGIGIRVKHSLKDRSLFREGDNIRAHVDGGDRMRSSAHHTSTHLLHAALRRVVGPRASQAGSSVAPHRLRLDYVCSSAPEEKNLRKVEEWVNRCIREDLPVETSTMDLSEALSRGAMALFEDKYAEKDSVRVVDIPGKSMELCGGTHVDRTGILGPFMILSDASISSGVRRIEAISGWTAQDHLLDVHRHMKEAAKSLQVKGFEDVVPAIAALQNSKKAVENELRMLKQELAFASLERTEPLLGSVCVDSATESVPVAVRILEGTVEQKALMKLGNTLKAQNPERAHVLINGKRILCIIDERTHAQTNAGNVLKAVFSLGIKGKGGGRGPMAQGSLQKPLGDDERRHLQQWASSSPSSPSLSSP